MTAIPTMIRMADRQERLAEGVLVNNHQARQHQEPGPDVGEARDDVVECCVIERHDVAEEGHRNSDQEHRDQRVSADHHDITEAAFAVHQGCQAPVRNAPQEEGTDNRCQLAEHVQADAVIIRVVKEAGKLRLDDRVEHQHRQQHHRRFDTASVFMFQIPEAVKRVEHDMG